MKTFKEMVEEVAGTAAAKEKLKGAKKGDKMTFTHHKHGEVTGEYRGMKRMGGRSYAHVEAPGKGAFWVPPHQVSHHKPANESVLDEAETVAAFDPAKPGYLLKKSSLGHHFLDAHHESPIGKKALASGKYTTKVIKTRDGSVTHVVPK